MNSRNYGLYAIVVAAAAVAALWLGVPAGTFAVLALVLVCPVMMLFMMREMHGGDDGHEPDSADQARAHDHTPR